MPRDKAKDNRLFNCGQPERKYVAGLYPQWAAVYHFLVNKCRDTPIEDSTYLQVYQLIYAELSYPVPE